MNTTRRSLCIVAFSLTALCAAPGAAPPMIGYQGKLVNGTNLVNGEVDMLLRVYDNPTEPIMLQCVDSGRVSVVDGLYSTYLGDNLISGDMGWTRMNGTFWIELVVNSVTMAPRERVVSVAYAMTAGGVTNGAIGTMELAYGAVMNANIADDAVDSSKIGDGAIAFSNMGQNSATNGQIMKWNGSDWAAANDLTSGGAALASYAESGSFSPSPQASGADAVAQGTGTRAQGSNTVVGGGLNNQIGTDANYSSIGGGSGNIISNGAQFATIGGGWGNRIGFTATHALIAGGSSNFIGNLAYRAAIGGGMFNTIDQGATDALIAGGNGNWIGESSYYSAIGGGYGNSVHYDVLYGLIAGGKYNAIRTGGTNAVISGGSDNRIGVDAGNALIAGGGANRIELAARYAVIGGGESNKIGTNATWATVPGGYLNAARGRYSLAAGRRARAMQDGTFVWADSQDADFTSAQTNSFLIRAAGGVGIGKTAPRAPLDVEGRIYSRGITVQDETFVTVTTTNDPIVNGLNLVAAYATATNLTPHSQPLNATNRVAVIVPPGHYNMDTGSLVMAAEFVDLVGLSSMREEQYIYGDGEPGGVLRQTANDVRIENLFLFCSRTNSGSRSAYYPDSSLTSTVVRNCRFGGSGGGRGYSMYVGERIYAGTYVDCETGDRSFGSGLSSEAVGSFVRCTAGEQSFGGYMGRAYGTFIDCTGGDESFAGGSSGEATGLFVRCRGGNFSFGGGTAGEASGRFEYCTGGGFSFAGWGTASGEFIGCDGGFESFGSRGEASGTFINCVGSTSCFGSHDLAYCSGFFVNCVGGTSSFGTDGFCSGVFINCAGTDYSFGGNQNGRLSGSLYNCVMKGSLWEGASTPAKISGRLENCTWGAGITITNGARIYNSTFAGHVNGEGSGTCRVAQVRCQSMNLGTLTNRIATPYNVVDADLD